MKRKKLIVPEKKRAATLSAPDGEGFSYIGQVNSTPAQQAAERQRIIANILEHPDNPFSLAMLRGMPGPTLRATGLLFAD